MDFLRRAWIVMMLVVAGTGLAQEPAVGDDAPPGVFQMPQLQADYQRLMLLMGQAVARGDHAAMAQVCAAGVKQFPRDATWRYNLACAQALLGHQEETLATLDQAVVLGFRDVNHMEQDADLESLRQLPRFREIIARAKTLPPPEPAGTPPVPAPVKDGIALVTAANTGWNAQLGMFMAFFEFPERPPAGTPPILKNGEVGDLIRQWHADGKAAGNHGDLYDNRDGDHSNMAYGEFPHLNRVEYDDEAQKALVHRGIDRLIMFNHPTIGNASLAGHRSLPRLMQLLPYLTNFTMVQYLKNHLYVYPEHRDHDPVAQGGRGDTFPANTPYVVISQGSSGSDRPFLHALACTLAAFRPDVKSSLIKSGLLAPTMQMIFRHQLKSVGTDERYLSGKAHPPVFTAGEINVMGMVKMANAMTLKEVPALVHLEVEEEDLPRHGVDYFDPVPTQKLFDTPCAIARVMRSTQRDFRLVVSAAKSLNPGGRQLSWRWVILQGDPEKIRIKLLDRSGTRAEIIVSHHERRPAAPDSPMTSDRVDIGVFVSNGKYWSAPSFITCYFPANERRTYDEHGRIASVDYAAAKDAYVDSRICARKEWRDEYQYADDGKLLGWKRIQGKQTVEYAPDGSMILSRDEQGRPRSTRQVRYVATAVNETLTTLAIEESPETRWHWYQSPDDRQGEIVSKEECDRRQQAAPRK